MQFAPRMIGDQLVSVDLVEEVAHLAFYPVDYLGRVTDIPVNSDSLALYHRLRNGRQNHKLDVILKASIKGPIK